MSHALSRLAALFRIPGYPGMATGVLILGIAYSFTFPYMSLFATTEVGMTPAALGVYMTLVAVSGIVIGTWLGVLSDRHLSRKLILLLALVASAVGFTVMAHTRDYTLLLLNGCLLLGIGSASFAQLFAYSKASLDARQAHHGDLAVTTLRTMFSLAWVLGPAVGAVLLASLGFGGLYLSASLTFLGVALIVLTFKAPPARPRDQARPASLRTLLRGKRMLATLLSFTLMGTASNMVMIILPLYVVQSLGGTKGSVGFLFSLAAALEIPLMLLLGMAAARLDKAKVITWAAAVHVAYFAAVLSAGQVWHLYPAQLLTATVVSITAGVGMAYFQDLIPDQPGAATTLYTNTTRLGAIVGGVTAGVIAGVFGYQAVFVVCAALSATAFILLRFLAHPGRAPHHASPAADPSAAD